MINKLFTAFALSLLFAASANAATLTIGGPDTATVGETFDITISGDFGADGLLAGGVIFFWDPDFVQLDNITLNLPVIADFSCPGSANCAPPTSSSATVTWGELFNDLIPIGAGETLMATLGFTAIGAAAEGLAVFSMASDPNAGGWFGAGFVSIAEPEFGSYEMQIVPLPAAVWFMIGGLGTLLGFRRK